MRLVDLRNERALSQAKLAREIGVAPSSIAHYELGERAPHLDIARKIAAFFGVSLDDLEFANDPREREAVSNG